VLDRQIRINYIINSLPELRKYPARSPAMPRGGYRPHIGYGNTDIVAEHFHYVSGVDSNGWILPTISFLPAALVSAFIPLVCHATVVAQRAGVNIAGGEVCIRVLHYPKQEKGNNPGMHTDFCYYTVPLFDSLRPGEDLTSESFYGQMAVDFPDANGEYHVPYRHCFKASDKEEEARVYVVAFVQQAFNSVSPVTGRTYAEALNTLCTVNDDTHKGDY
jgi:hypothetical protein